MSMGGAEGSFFFLDNRSSIKNRYLAVYQQIPRNYTRLSSISGGSHNNLHLDCSHLFGADGSSRGLSSSPLTQNGLRSKIMVQNKQPDECAVSKAGVCPQGEIRESIHQCEKFIGF